MQDITNTNNQTILLSNGRYVDLEFLNYIRDVVMERIPSLPKHTEMKLKNICGKHFWSKFDDGEKRRAGWCMVHLVAKGELPMISVNKYRYQLPKRYQLK